MMIVDNLGPKGDKSDFPHHRAWNVEKMRIFLRQRSSVVSFAKCRNNLYIRALARAEVEKDNDRFPGSEPAVRKNRAGTVY